MGNLLLYYVTDRTQFARGEPQRRRRLLEKIAEATRWGVDYIQLREKDLSPRELESLAREVVDTISLHGKGRTRLLVNSRTDIAFATGADGVHLRSNDISPLEVRSMWHACNREAPPLDLQAGKPVIAVSCHTADEVATAAENGSNFVVFGPVFEKRGEQNLTPAGLSKLRQACRYNVPVLAIGGVTLENASQCLDAGAVGIAAIRLFQENAIAAVVGQTRSE